MSGNLWHKRALLLCGIVLIVCAVSCADTVDIGAFVSEEPSVVFGAVSQQGWSVAFLTHSKALDLAGVIFGDVLLVHIVDQIRVVDVHRGRLSSSHIPGYLGHGQFLFSMMNSETSQTELCYLLPENQGFRTFAVPARFIGAMVIWDDVIFYSTEHFDENIHFVDIDDGEVHMVGGSVEWFSNTDFWIIDGDLIVTYGGDHGIPYRLDTEGLYPAPNVAVSPETKVGFNLRTIRDSPDLARFEELLGIR